MIEFRFKPDALDLYGLPDIPYPLPTETLQKIIEQDGTIPFADMLHGLQQRSSNCNADWQKLEPSLDRLAELLTRYDDRQVISAAGRDWWIEIGRVEFNQPLVTIQRQDQFVAVLCKRDDGRLRLTTFRPLDGKSASSIISLGFHSSHADGTICMRPNNWEYALDCSAGIGNWYAFERGEAFLSYLNPSAEQIQNGTFDDRWQAISSLPQRPSSKIAIELGVAHAFSSATLRFPWSH